MSVSKGISLTTKACVATLLEAYPSCRDSDIKLYLYYLAVYHGLAKKIGSNNCRILSEIMFEAPPSESIRRVRQKLQEGGEFVGENRKARMTEQQRVFHNLTRI